MPAKLLAATVLAVALLAPATAQAARQWQPAVALSAPAGFETSDQPEVAVDPQGAAVAVWYRFNGSNYIVQAATRPPRGTWSEPQDLSTAGQDVGSPEVGVDAQGNAVAVWARDNGSHYIVQAATRPAGGGPDRDGWSEPQDISVAGADNFGPELAVDEQGNAVAVWRRKTASGGSPLQVATRPVGSGWSEPHNLTPSIVQPGDQPFDHHVDAAQGHAAVIWDVLGPGALQAAGRPAGGVWSERRDVSGAGPGEPQHPSIAVDRQGTAVAVWSRETTDSLAEPSTAVIQTASQHVAVEGPWPTQQNISAGDQHAVGPEVEFDASGKALAVWQRGIGHFFMGLNNHIEVADRSAAGSWSTPDALTPSEQSAGSPRLAVSPRGDAVVAWSRFEGQVGYVGPAKYTPVAATRAAGDGWSGGQDLFPGAAFQVWPRVGIDSDGDAMAVWSGASADDSSRIVRAGAFEDPNAPVVPPPTGGGGGGGTGTTPPPNTTTTADGTTTTPAPSPTATRGTTTTGTTLGTGAPQPLPQPGTGTVPFVGTTTAMRLALRRCITRARRASTSARRRTARIRCERAGRPAGVTARAASTSAIILSFRAPGSVGRGGPPAKRYVIKQSTRPIRSERDFARALTLCRRTCAFTPQRRGQRLSLRITQLRSKRTYYYAIKAVGAGRRTGPRSETVRVRTR